VQAEVSRREKETAVAMQEAAEARKGYTAFREVAAPYEAMIRAEGSDPIRAAASLFQTAAALRTAPGPHKAQILASMIQQYGVPIEALADALDGKRPQGQQGQPQEFRDPRFDQLMQQIEASKSQRTEAMAAKARQDVEAFAAKNEFFEDVRQTMADLREVKARRGEEATLEQLYTQAIQLHPEIAEVVRQRDAAKNAANANASTQRSKLAASSVRGSPAAPVKRTEGENAKDTRADVEAAMAALSGR
jgi:hypothetical protein